ncbi:MAG: VOC family protein [Balneolaceae bacterium]|nr:VOC family protein [Balneolaceae bacterium]
MSYKMRFIPILLLFLILSPASYGQLNLSIDHIPVVVHSLDSAKATFSKQGFSIKPGLQIPNGLDHSFIEFDDGTELELMEVQAPSDSIARHYANVLEEGEGGVYLALTTFSLGLLKEQLRTQSIPFDTLTSQNFDYVSFRQKGLSHLFFVRYQFPNRNQKLYTEHRINTDGIHAVTIQGTHQTVDFFRKLGFDVSIRSAYEYRVPLSDKQHITIQLQQTPYHLRVTEVTLSETPTIDMLLHGIQLRY